MNLSITYRLFFVVFFYFPSVVFFLRNTKSWESPGYRRRKTCSPGVKIKRIPRRSKHRSGPVVQIPVVSVVRLFLLPLKTVSLFLVSSSTINSGEFQDFKTGYGFSTLIVLSFPEDPTTSIQKAVDPSLSFRFNNML